MRRVIAPERLDELSPADPRAIGSRADLRRLNLLMGHARILSCGLRWHLGATLFRAPPLRFVELGAGDGSLFSRVAHRLAPLGLSGQVTLVDRQELVSAETRRTFARLNWSMDSLVTDVFTWLGQPFPVADVMLANLFLHHFSEEPLAELLRLAAARTNLFMACEPRRSSLALTASRFVWLLGCNGITQHDALVSVRAGFSGRELSALWPAGSEWDLSENPAGCFSHCLVAKRNA